MAMFGKRERKKEKRCKGKGKGKEKKKREKKKVQRRYKESRQVENQKEIHAKIRGISLGQGPRQNLGIKRKDSPIFHDIGRYKGETKETT